MIGYSLLMWWISLASAAAPVAAELDYAAVANDPWLRRRGVRLSGNLSPRPSLAVGASLLVAPPFSQADLTPLLRDVLELTARRPTVSRVLLYAAPEARLRLLEHRVDDRGSSVWLVASGGVCLTDVPAFDRATFSVDPEQTVTGWHGSAGLGVSAQAWRGVWGAQVRIDAQLYAQPYDGTTVWETPLWLSVGFQRRSPPLEVGTPPNSPAQD